MLRLILRQSLPSVACTVKNEGNISTIETTFTDQLAAANADYRCLITGDLDAKLNTFYFVRFKFKIDLFVKLNELLNQYRPSSNPPNKTDVISQQLIAFKINGNPIWKSACCCPRYDPRSRLPVIDTEMRCKVPARPWTNLWAVRKLLRKPPTHTFHTVQPLHLV